MANWSTLKAAVANVIKTNGNNEITGALMQSTLNSIISNLGGNYQFVDIATTTTVPGTPDGNVFYIAMDKGTYSNFGGIILGTDDGIVILAYNGTWNKKNIPIASVADITQIKEDLAQVESDLNETALLKKIEGIKISSGNNLLTRNYTEPQNPFEYEKGGDGKLINSTGVVVDYVDFYSSPLIEWGSNIQAIIYRCRCWAQYGDDGVALKGIYYPATAPAGNVLIDKSLNAKYFRVSISSWLGNCMLNYGNILLPYEPYKDIVTKRTYGATPLFFQANVDEIARFKEMLLSESYIPQAPAYTDGTVNSPINVIWADGDTGVLTLTRNTDGLVTKIVATKIRSGVATTLTENITRDTDGNVTLISIV